MKKRKILIPAAALVSFATITAVTGTVAWFTSNTTAQVKFSEFGISKRDSNLSVTTTGLVGVTASDNVITANEAGEGYCTLVDASFDGLNGDVFGKDSMNNTEKKSAGTTDYGNLVSTNADLIAGYVDPTAETKVASQYYVFAWKSTFTYNIGSADCNLYFDVDSEVTASTESGSTKIVSERGFRLAMCTSYGEWVVWSPKQQSGAQKYADETTADPSVNNRYVHDNSGTITTVDYTKDVDVIGEDTALEPIESTSKGSADRADCLGTFAAGANTITVTFVAWFEGEDINIVNATNPHSVSGTLDFYIRENNA